MKISEIELLTWDSEWLGLPVARFVAPATISAAEVNTVIAKSRGQGIRLLYLVLNPDAFPETVHAIQTAGVHLMDVKCIYEMEIAAWPEYLLSTPAINMQMDSTLVFTKRLRELARASGEHSRFRRDEKLDEIAFHALYDQWLQRLLVQGKVWEVRVDNDVVGLLAMNQCGSVSTIELLAVAPTARRQRIGQYMVQFARREAQRQQMSLLRVVTQGANTPARQLYEGCGFRLRHTSHWYHLW